MTLYTHIYRRPRSRAAFLLLRWWRRLVPGHSLAAAAPSRRHALMAAVDARRDDARVHSAASR